MSRRDHRRGRPEDRDAIAQVIDGSGMICIPSFVDTHFHLWNSMFRLYVRADVPHSAISR
jgi:cytosine/adenosine deaminase-related metal-dependent hydrolase